MELDEFLVLRLATPPGRIAALELMADLSRPVARQQQRQRLSPREPLAQVGKADSRLLLAPACGLDEADQIAAFEINVTADVAPEQVVERRPAEQRPEHARPRDDDARP